METYEWQKNKAVVDRLYYSERILQTTTFFTLAFTATSALYIQKGYFPDLARKRIPKAWTYWAGVNAICLFILLRPLTREEISIQWRKRKVMGKWLYSLYHLDSDDRKKQEAAGQLA